MKACHNKRSMDLKRYSKGQFSRIRYISKKIYRILAFYLAASDLNALYGVVPVNKRYTFIKYDMLLYPQAIAASLTEQPFKKSNCSALLILVRFR